MKEQSLNTVFISALIFSVCCLFAAGQELPRYQGKGTVETWVRWQKIKEDIRQPNDRQKPLQELPPAQSATQTKKNPADSDNVEILESAEVVFFRKEANRGKAKYQFALGCCYYYGDGVEEDATKAVDWFRKAAEQGNVDAQFNLGNSYYYGEGVDRDYAKAVEWYRGAANQGHSGSQNNLGHCYFNGYGVDKNYGKAAELYRKAADQRYSEAQYSLGQCYREGKGVNKDWAEAAKWYNRAAEQGNVGAQFNLGLLYYYGGNGLQKSLTDAKVWFQKAADQGDGKARKRLEDILNTTLVDRRCYTIQGVDLGYNPAPTSDPAKRKAGEPLVLGIYNVLWCFRWCPAGKTANELDAYGFWIGETEVTQKQWAVVMGGLLDKDGKKLEGAFAYDDKTEFSIEELARKERFVSRNRPIICVSWDDCQQFIDKLNKPFDAVPDHKFALPTEAQWEYACRAGGTTVYCFGNDKKRLGDYAVYSGFSEGEFRVDEYIDKVKGKTTQMVGSKTPNAWGVFDMHGNVAEWCQDASFVEKTWGGKKQVRVVRGGTFSSPAEVCTSAYTSYHVPAYKNFSTGFRLCLVEKK
jgi:TPR repeat protein